jgi:hypothetical protein
MERTSALSPDQRTVDLAGAPAARFHRWGGFIDLGTSFGLIPTNRAPLSFVAWFQGPNDIRFQNMAGHGDAYWRAGFDNASQKNRFNPGNGTELAGVLNLNDGAWHQLAGVSDGTNDALYLDGVLHATNVANVISGAIIPTNQNHAVIGGAPDYGAAINYQVTRPSRCDSGMATLSQVAFYTNALTPANIATLYGAAQVPPLITLQPASGQIRWSGTPLSLTVSAVGSPPLSYQWYRGPLGLGTPLSNGGGISGATATNLVINPATLSDTNFYVVVSNPYNSVTSILSVLSFVPHQRIHTRKQSLRTTRSVTGDWVKPTSRATAQRLSTILGDAMECTATFWWASVAIVPHTMPILRSCSERTDLTVTWRAFRELTSRGLHQTTRLSRLNAGSWGH